MEEVWKPICSMTLIVVRQNIWGQCGLRTTFVQYYFDSVIQCHIIAGFFYSWHFTNSSHAYIIHLLATNGKFLSLTMYKKSIRVFRLFIWDKITVYSLSLKDTLGNCKRVYCKPAQFCTVHYTTNANFVSD